MTPPDPAFIEKQRQAINAAYHQLSLEQDIPLDIAHAIVVNGVYILATVSQARSRGRSPNQIKAGITAWGRAWELVGGHLGWSAQKIDSVMLHATNLVMPVVMAALDAALEVQRRDRGQA